MKRIAKVFILVLLLILSVTLSGCNEVEPNENSVRLYLDSKFDNYMLETAPDFVFSFNGNLNTIENVNKTYYTVFSNNEDDILSEALTNLFDQYKDKMFVETVDVSNVAKRKYSHLDENGKLYNVDMVCDDGKVYDESAYIMLDNGLKLTVDYCRFVSNGKTYYTWRYSRSISMYLYYPLMVISDKSKNDERRVVLLTLPNMVSFKVNPDQKVASLVSKDTYLDESLYTFEYYVDETIENFDKKKWVTDYYQDYDLEKLEDDVYTFTYLTNKFKLTLRDGNFLIQWQEKVQ